jgi:Tetratricopeptide repeat
MNPAASGWGAGGLVLPNSCLVAPLLRPSMTRYEKATLSLLLLSLILKIAFVAGASALFLLVLLVLGFSYLAGGYWLFYRETADIPIRIIAGVAFATALMSFFYTSRVDTGLIYKILPTINGIFCLGLVAYSLLRHRNAGFAMPYGLFLRSILLLTISAFFAYCPISFWPYRKALILLNQGRGYIISNLRMFDYRAQYDAAMGQEDYPSAVVYGRQALEMGKRWLEDDSIKLRWKISGTYTNLYTAYKRLGDVEYNQRQYEKALQAYQAGNTYLVAGDHRENGREILDKYWEEEKAWSQNNMAFCYLKLRRFDEGDSLFLGAIKSYKKVYPTPDLYSARLTGDLATSLTAQSGFNASNQLLLNINRFLAKDTARKAVAMRIANTLDIGLNYIQQDSLAKALRVLQSIIYPRSDTTANRYKAGLQEALCLYKLERYEAVPKALEQPLAYYKHHARYWEAAALCEVMLAKNSLAQASYRKAQEYVSAAQAILLAEKQGPASSLNGSCLSVQGTLNKALGQYNLADQQLAQAVAAVRQDRNYSAGTLSEALAQLADLDVTLGREMAAREHIGSALALLLQGKPMVLPSQTGVQNGAAYIAYLQAHYSEASRKYRQVVAINARYGQGQNGTTATAWNGLGLVEMAQHRYERADSVFGQAQRLHEKLFTEHHPLTATVYLNYGLLRLKQSRRAEANVFFEKARSIAQTFLPADHDMFGDLAVAMGDLAAQEKQATVAHGYYEQALAIYAHKFPASHWKVKAAKQKARA